MQGVQDQRVRARRKRERKIWRGAFLLSVLLHLLVLLTWGDSDPISPLAAAGPDADDDEAARGGLQVVEVRTPEQRPVVPPPVPVPVLEEVEEVEVDEVSEVDPAQAEGEGPPDPGPPGTEEGEGEGDAGTADEGRNRGIEPPRPRGMIIPPTDPDLRGREIEVWVFVDERGRVVADSTRLDPPTPDRAYNRRLISEAAEWIFHPARRDGEPVAAWYPYVIEM